MQIPAHRIEYILNGVLSHKAGAFSLIIIPENARLLSMHFTSSTIRKIVYWNLLFAASMLSLGATSYLRRFHRYDRLIVNIAREHELDPRLVTALIWTESRFDPTQVGTSGEIGLMQLTETAAREWAQDVGNSDFIKEDLFQPDCNIHAGCWYLSRAVSYWSKKYSDPLPYALAEYNAGRSNARRWSAGTADDSEAFWSNISYPTTKKYVYSILERYRGGV